MGTTAGEDLSTGTPAFCPLALQYNATESFPSISLLFVFYSFFWRTVFAYVNHFMQTIACQTMDYQFHFLLVSDLSVCVVETSTRTARSVFVVSVAQQCITRANFRCVADTIYLICSSPIIIASSFCPYFTVPATVLAAVIIQQRFSMVNAYRNVRM